MINDNLELINIKHNNLLHNIKKLRLKKGITQQQLANDFKKYYNLSVSKSTICKLELGIQKLDSKLLLCYINYFNIEVNDMFN